MNEKLIKLLGLAIKPDARPADVESAILAAVKTLADGAAAAKAALDEKNVIVKMIADSHGALNETSARQVLAHRVAFAKANPPPKPAAKPRK